MASSPYGRRVRGAALAILLALAAGACGGSSTAKSSTATTVTTPPTTTPTSVATTTTLRTVTTVKSVTTTAPPAPSVAQDVAAAQRILLKPSDLPGYTPSGSSQINGYVSNYSTCAKDPLLPGGQTPRSASQGGFLLDETAIVRAAQTTSISSFAAFASTPAEAQRVFTELAAPDVVQCVGKALATALRAVTSSGAPATASNTALPALGLGDESIGLRTTVPGLAAVSQYFDLTVVRRGRALAFLFVSRIAKDPQPETDRQRLAGVLVSRMA